MFSFKDISVLKTWVGAGRRPMELVLLPSTPSTMLALKQHLSGGLLP